MVTEYFFNFFYLFVWKNGKNNFSQFYTQKDRKKLKEYSVTIIVLTFHCSNNLFLCNFEIFQGTEIKKSESQKHYKFLAFGL